MQNFHENQNVNIIFQHLYSLYDDKLIECIIEWRNKEYIWGKLCGPISVKY